MRLAGRQTAEILDFIGPYVKPGVTTDELDALCHKFMVETPGLTYGPMKSRISAVWRPARRMPSMSSGDFIETDMAKLS